MYFNRLKINFESLKYSTSASN